MTGAIYLELGGGATGLVKGSATFYLRVRVPSVLGALVWRDTCMPAKKTLQLRIRDLPEQKHHSRATGRPLCKLGQRASHIGEQYDVNVDQAGRCRENGVIIHLHHRD